MAVVTLPGASGGIVTVQAGTGDHIFVAQIIANTILTASVTGSLNPIQTVTAGSGSTTAPPPTGGVDQSILYLEGSGGGTISIPGGYNYVVDLLTGPETITGSNLQVISYNSVGAGAGATIVLTGTDSVAADPADNNTVSLVGSFNTATGDGNNTITATGAGTIGSGTGTNDFTVAPTTGAGIRVQSSGVGDTVNVVGTLGGGTATVLASGSGVDLYSTGVVTVDAVLSGTGGSVYGGVATTNIDASGTDAVIFGGFAGSALSLLDTGLGDTLAAFAATSASVTEDGTSGVIIGGSGALTASIGGAGVSDTVAGGSGSTYVSAGGSNSNIWGGTGALTVYDNGTADSIGAFGASSANVTLAGSGTLLFGGTNALTADVDNTAETIVGGSGSGALSIANLGLATDDLVLGGPGTLAIDDEGRGDTIGSFTSSSATVTVGGINDLVFGGTGTLNATVSGTNDTIAAFSGSSTIDATSAAVVFGDAGTVNFIGGAGTSSILGGTGGSEVMTVGSGGLSFWTGSDNTSTIFGSAAQTTIVGGSLSSVYYSSVGGSGGFDYLAGTGNESLDAGGSTASNTLGFFANVTSITGSSDTVSGWTTNDSLFLVGYDSATSSISTSNGNVVFNLSNGTTITFTDVTEADLSGKYLYS